MSRQRPYRLEGNNSTLEKPAKYPWSQSHDREETIVHVSWCLRTSSIIHQTERVRDYPGEEVTGCVLAVGMLYIYTHTHTHTHGETKTERQRQRQTGRQTDRQTETETKRITTAQACPGLKTFTPNFRPSWCFCCC